MNPDQIHVEPQSCDGRTHSFLIKRGNVILGYTTWHPGSDYHPQTETEAKCWADLFADALRMKRELEQAHA